MHRVGWCGAFALLVALAGCGDDGSDGESSDGGAEGLEATTRDGTGTRGEGDGDGDGDETSGDGDGDGDCVPPMGEPCGHELLCCDDQYCHAGDCEACKPAGSACDGHWLGEECCDGACVAGAGGDMVCE